MKLVLVLLGMISLALAGCGPAQAQTGSSPAVSTLTPEEAIIRAINVERTQRGLGALVSDSTLAKIAAGRSLDMVVRNYFGHFDPVTGEVKLSLKGVSFTLAGENLAEMIGTSGVFSDVSPSLVRGWMRSPTHRENLLNPRYRKTGVGIAISRDGLRLVAVQVFSD